MILGYEISDLKILKEWCPTLLQIRLAIDFHNVKRIENT